MSASSIPWTVGFVHRENVSCRSPWSAGRQNHAKRADTVVMNFAVRSILPPSSEFPERACLEARTLEASVPDHSSWPTTPAPTLGGAAVALGLAVAFWGRQLPWDWQLPFGAVALGWRSGSPLR
jgi:hypothetical protein